jgi:hypothetical protein
MMSIKPVLAGLAVALMASPAAALDPATLGSCSPTKIKFVASDELRFRTTSQSYVDLPQASISFTQGGRKASCVLVRFSANANGNRNMGFRAMLDGTQAALPYEGQISDGADKGPNARRFTFIFASVTPGVHNVKIQYQMTSQGGFADMNAHNTIVSFAPK